ncbi:GD23734 [Drosophila simulans]|uniref:GD23734 n=1 Tax=Drosophila simulans TaxID=7240 RepID=B4Q9U1_DROSI|nr:GD23734 [Drosophila simulans]
MSLCLWSHVRRLPSSSGHQQHHHHHHHQPNHKKREQEQKLMQKLHPRWRAIPERVVKEDNLPPHEWRLGRIVSAFPGADDRIRVVEIRTSRGTIKRPVHKVILLPMEDKESSVPRD